VDETSQNASPPQPTQSTPIRPERSSLLGIMRTARKYWATVLATAVAVALGVTFYTLGQPKIYQASSTIQLDPNPPRPLGQKVETVVDMGNGSYWNNREYYETQYMVIQSMRVALSVVRDLGLDHDASFARNMPTSAHSTLPNNYTAEDAAEILRTRLKVEPVKESRLAVIRFEDADPARAQRILATVVDTYIEQNLEDALTSTSSAAEWLRSQLDKLKGDLESSEMALHEFKMNNNILSVAFDDQSNMLREEMKQINDAVTSVRTKQQEVAARREELRKVPTDDPSSLPASELLQSPLLQLLRQRYEEAVRDRNAIKAENVKGAKHPDVLAAEQRVEDTRKALLNEVRNIQGALDRDLAVVSRQEGGLSGLFQKAQKQALDLNLMEIEYKRLQRTKENTEKLYSLVLERTKESDLTRMLRVNNIKTIDKALVPKSQIRPRVPLNIAFGILGGLALGLALAMARDLADRSIKTPDDVEHDLSLTFLGLLPEMEEATTRPTYGKKQKRPKPSAKGNRETVVHEFPTSGIAEAARAIRTNLMFMAPDKPHKTLLVTSAGPAEGKTTVACCIAIAMAQAGMRVVLIDCDMRRPRMHRIFGRDNTVGVTSALLDMSIATEDAFRTEIPNLSVVPAGPIPPNPAELLHSEAFRRLLKHFQDTYDRVIIDSPPVVAVTDATILSTLTDGVVLVVRAFKTSKDLCRQAVRSLRDVSANTLGCVLNAVDLGRQEYGQYHYYYYQSDKAYSPLPADEQRPTAPH
jgi:capsular exopolysaccharide synthesis family protein